MLSVELDSLIRKIFLDYETENSSYLVYKGVGRLGVGSDIDIIFDKIDIIQRAKTIVDDSHFKLIVRRGSADFFPGVHKHLDIYFEGVFQVRLDMINRVAYARKFPIKSQFLDNILESYSVAELGARIPSKRDIDRFRLIEFFSLYHQYPSKFKHFQSLIEGGDDLYITNILLDMQDNVLDYYKMEKTVRNVYVRRFIVGFIPGYVYLARDLFRKTKSIGILGVIGKIRGKRR